MARFCMYVCICTCVCVYSVPDGVKDFLWHSHVSVIRTKFVECFVPDLTCATVGVGIRNETLDMLHGNETLDAAWEWDSRYAAWE